MGVYGWKLFFDYVLKHNPLLYMTVEKVVVTYV
jgi:hypothetical protein